MDFLEGEVLLLNKSYDWTSFDLVNKVRAMLRHKLELKKIKVGHAGTLDPLATGLMVVCTGKATKKIESLTGLDKEYIATLHIGATTPTYDLESLVDVEYPTEHINLELIEGVLQLFKGTIQQTPPIFSAIKVNGKKAYDLARKGQDVEMKSRVITIAQIEVLQWEKPTLVLRISCSKGTYIRSLANDIGKALNSGAYLADLERTRIGSYTLSEALNIEQFEDKLKSMTTN